MRVSLGYSQEHGDGKWSKMDLMLEEDDLRRLLAERGISPDSHVRVIDVFQMLTLEADALLHARMASLGLVDQRTLFEKLERASNFHVKVVSRLKENSDG